MMLKVENLDVYYGDAQALDGVCLEIEQGAKGPQAVGVTAI